MQMNNFANERHQLQGINIRYLLAMQVKAMRQDRGLSQSALAKKAGIEIEAIQNIENPDSNYDIPIKILAKIARACDVGLFARFVPFGYSQSTLSPQGYEGEQVKAIQADE